MSVLARSEHIKAMAQEAVSTAKMKGYKSTGRVQSQKNNSLTKVASIR